MPRSTSVASMYLQSTVCSPDPGTHQSLVVSHSSGAGEIRPFFSFLNPWPNPALLRCSVTAVRFRDFFLATVVSFNYQPRRWLPRAHRLLSHVSGLVAREWAIDRAATVLYRPCGLLRDLGLGSLR